MFKEFVAGAHATPYEKVVFFSSRTILAPTSLNLTYFLLQKGENRSKNFHQLMQNLTKQTCTTLKIRNLNIFHFMFVLFVYFKN